MLVLNKYFEKLVVCKPTTNKPTYNKFKNKYKGGIAYKQSESIHIKYYKNILTLKKS